MDNIFRAMQGCRIFERFGFNLHKTKNILDNQRVTLSYYVEWTFIHKNRDWLNTVTKQPLTGYLASNDLVFLINHNIDTGLQ